MVCKLTGLAAAEYIWIWIMAEQVKVNSREIACECMNWVDVAQGRMQCLAGCCGAGEETLGFFYHKRIS